MELRLANVPVLMLALALGAAPAGAAPPGPTIVPTASYADGEFEIELQLTSNWWPNPYFESFYGFWCQKRFPETNVIVPIDAGPWTEFGVNLIPPYPYDSITYDPVGTVKPIPIPKYEYRCLDILRAYNGQLYLSDWTYFEVELTDLASFAWPEEDECPVLVDEPLIPPVPHSPAPVVHNTTYCYKGTSTTAELEADVAQPDPTLWPGPRPVLIVIHGGGWALFNKSYARDDIVRAAERGYVGVAIDYRLVRTNPFVPGAFINTHPAQIEDVQCAIRWVKATAPTAQEGDPLYGADPTRIGLIGGSAGGHLALLAGFADDGVFEKNGQHATKTSRVKAVVNLFGPTHLGLQHSEGVDPSVVENTFGGSPTEAPANYWLGSPLSFITGDDPPVLTIQGEIDLTVPPINATVLDTAAEGVGVDHCLLPMPGFPHTLAALLPNTYKELSLEFFDRQLDP